MLKGRWAFLLPLALAAAAGLGYGSLIEPRWLRVRKRAVALSRLPPALDGYRIAHLSDLHLGAPGFAAHHLGAAARLRPDLFVVTGDLIEQAAAVAMCAELLGQLPAPDGVVCVLGNHEHRAFRRQPGGPGPLVRALAERGVRTLANQAMRVQRNGAHLWVAGVDDPHHRRDDVSLALAAVPPDECVLLLAHSPDVLLRLGQHRPDLVLTGHCHGGQVRAPWGAIVTRTRIRLPEVLGLQWIGGLPVHLSAGLGATVPLRFLCRPEITVLELRSR